MESINLLKHDMKNHLIMLNEMYENNSKDEIQPYISRILNGIDNSTRSNSNNFVIDSIVNFKLRVLQDKDVTISLDINIPHTINILAHDLTIILGNLLDNAIIATLRSKEKKLRIQISCSMDNLIILIDNSYDGNLIVENGQLKTTKIFKATHGLGLISIAKSLESYGGELRTEYTSNIFTTSVVIPYIR